MYVLRIYLIFQNASQIKASLSQYKALCTDTCIAAQSALETCVSAAVDDGERLFCLGICRSSADAVINACPIMVRL